MTTFVLSHNLQLQSASAPAFDLQQLADGLTRHTKHSITTSVLSHPHWLLSLEGDAMPTELAEDLVSAWMKFRAELMQDIDHVVLALGGRKDTPASPGSPLQEGFWGVDVVETKDAATFLREPWASTFHGYSCLLSQPCNSCRRPFDVIR